MSTLANPNQAYSAAIGGPPESVLRRTLDIAVAVLALAVLSPLLLALALAIVVDSPGHPFHRGWRVGQGGTRFRIWKFRSMLPARGRPGPPITGAADPRVTRVGRFLRKTKLDELPQFVNLLLGDMTLVGPRPEAPEMVAHYTPAQMAVLAAKPGMTGQGQISWPDEEESIPAGVAAERYYVEHLLARKVDADLDYLRHRTALSDARIVWATVVLVLSTLRKKL
jgi:lipopolysaccharide/colanic/teichoic acid biosynthesis glycosyltransferase